MMPLICWRYRTVGASYRYRWLVNREDAPTLEVAWMHVEVLRAERIAKVIPDGHLLVAQP